MPIETMSRSGARRSGSLRGFELTGDEREHRTIEGGVEAVEGSYFLHRSQPRQLTLRQLARGEHAALAQRGLAELAFDEPPRLAIADAAHRRHVGAQRKVLAQRPQLVDQTVREHRIEARF